jgi:hypothetical protein
VVLTVIAGIPVAASGSSHQPKTGNPLDGCDSLQELGPDFRPLLQACRYALDLPRTLPNLVCTETVQRKYSTKRKADIVTAEVKVERMHSHYAYVTVNGKAHSRPGATGDELFTDQITSTGEFAHLFNVFNESTRTEFAPPKDDVVRGRREKRYDFRVGRENNHAWTWFFLGSATNPGYHGSLYVDSISGSIARLTLEVNSSEVGVDTPVSEATTTIEYGDVVIGSAGTRHVPTNGQNASCFRRVLTGCVQENFTFTDFHLFGADTRIIP